MSAPARPRPVPGAPSIPGRGRVVGLDLGARRVGVAVSDSDQHLAVGVGRLDRSRDLAADRRALARTVEEYEAVGVVVGLPLALSGAVGKAAAAAQAEVAALEPALAVPVETIDERLTTVTAAADLRAAGRRARDQRAVIDQTAAAVLLQAWLDRRVRAADGGGAVRG